jgi:hypothetical protein
LLALIQNIQAASATRRDREAALLRDLDASILDRIEDVMDEREARTRSASFKSTLSVLVLVPLAVVAIHRWLL